MSLAKASVWTATSTLIKILVGLLIIKLLALSFGPEGVGLAGNFRQLVAVLAVLSGAGIFNGITKSVAENKEQPERLKEAIGSASFIILTFSLLLSVCFILLAKEISHYLFDVESYQWVIQTLAVVQLGIAYANFFLAIIKGYRDARSNAISIIIGSVLGTFFYLLCFYWFDYEGALIGLSMIPATIVIPALFMLYRKKYLPLSYFKPVFHKSSFRLYGRFIVMALITCVTLPVAYILIRNLLAQHYSWQQVGIWQGVTTISDAYLQFITATFSVYLLPTLARLTDKNEIAKEIYKSLRFVLPAVAVVGLLIWFMRDFAIWLLFSVEFVPMRELFLWQLIGDVLKVGAYVFGYFVIAKASLRFYALAEICQFVLLIMFAYLLVPANGALGAAQAYFATYILYFPLCCLVFVLYRRYSR